MPNSRFMTPRFIDQVAADLKQGFASPRRLTDQKANVTGASTTGARRRKRAYSRLKAVLRTAWPRRTGIIRRAARGSPRGRNSSSEQTILGIEFKVVVAGGAHRYCGCRYRVLAPAGRRACWPTGRDRRNDPGTPIWVNRKPRAPTFGATTALMDSTLRHHGARSTCRGGVRNNCTSRRRIAPLARDQTGPHAGSLA